MSDYILLYILFAPFAGAIALIFTSNRQAMLVRGIAAVSAGMSLLASLYLFYAYDPVKGGYQFIQKFEWSRQLGIALHLGVVDDGGGLVDIAVHVDEQPGVAQGHGGDVHADGTVARAAGEDRNAALVGRGEH